MKRRKTWESRSWTRVERTLAVVLVGMYIVIAVLAFWAYRVEQGMKPKFEQSAHPQKGGGWS